MHVEKCFKSFISIPYKTKIFVIGGRKVRNKILKSSAVFDCDKSICTCASSAITPAKKCFTHRWFQASRGKPPKPPKPGLPKKGIATGVVSNPPPASDRWAIIIGMSDYKGDLYDLDYCDDDTWDFYNALVNEYGWSSNHIAILTDGQATKANIQGVID